MIPLRFCSYFISTRSSREEVAKTYPNDLLSPFVANDLAPIPLNVRKPSPRQTRRGRKLSRISLSDGREVGNGREDVVVARLAEARDHVGDLAAGFEP